MNKVVRLVQRAITEYSMITADDTVLVGFSGGSDSVCLLSVLFELGYNVTAAHLNHNMRDTAKRDMDFCENFCKERNIPFVSKTTKKGTLKNEADAREARYSFFADIMKEYGLSKIATAHNKNDSAETVLLHLLRGAATDGLCGISPKDDRIIRPLIFVKKSEVNSYCDEKGIPFVTDETNLTNIYTRNKLRNIYIPELEKEFNPKLVDTLADNALLMSYDRDFMSKTAKNAFDDLKTDRGIKVSGFCELDYAIRSRVAELIWQKAVNDVKNLPKKYIEDIIRLTTCLESGKGIDLPLGYAARIEYGELIIEKKNTINPFEQKIETGKWYNIPEIDSMVGVFEDGKGLKISLDGDECLIIRSRKQGDRFTPSGLQGSKTVSDYFTDSKIPRKDRDAVPILIADGKIAAVGDLRSDDEFKTGKRACNYVLRIIEN